MIKVYLALIGLCGLICFGVAVSEATPEIVLRFASYGVRLAFGVYFVATLILCIDLGAGVGPFFPGDAVLNKVARICLCIICAYNIPDLILTNPKLAPFACLLAACLGLFHHVINKKLKGARQQ